MTDSALKAILEIARQLVGSLTKSDGLGLLAEVARYEPLFARVYRDSILSSWLESARDSLDKSENPAVLSAGEAKRFNPLKETSVPVVRLPQIDLAVRDLFSREAVTREQLVQLDQEARRAAFSLGRGLSVETVAVVRDALAENVRDGGTLKDFRDTIKERLAGSPGAPLSPHLIETTYRTQTAQAYSAGQRAILESPLVSGGFPYVMWSATHDSRVRHDHIEMESFGQNGTAVYRVDDPIWEVLYPPAHYNCRCLLIPLSIADAAKHGSEEAKAWLESGEEPLQPDWVSPPYPITPPKGWPIHRRVQAVV